MTPCVASEEASAILPALTKLLPIFCCLFIDNVMIFLSLVKFVRGCRVSRRPRRRYKTEDTGRIGSRVTAGNRMRPLLEYLRDNHGFAVDSFQVYNYQRPETLKSSVNFPASRMVAGISAAPTQFLHSQQEQSDTRYLHQVKCRSVDKNSSH
jgi:hypothetical protein